VKYKILIFHFGYFQNQEMKKIVLFGGGSHCRCVIDIIEANNEFLIVGIIDSIAKIGSEISNHKVIGRQDNLLILIEEYKIDGGVVSLGDNYARMKIVKEILGQCPDFIFFNVIHPSAIISNTVTFGNGNVIMQGVIINVGATIKNHCIINTGSQFEHFSTMANYSSISAGVITGGYVKLKKYASIALGVTVFDRITIGRNAVVGSGSLVTKDIEENCLAYGVPAKFIRKRQFNERFLK